MWFQPKHTDQQRQGLGWFGLGAIVVLVACQSPPAAEVQRPYRHLPDLDLRIFACTPNPESYQFLSPTALAQTITELAAYCPHPPYRGLQASFQDSLRQAGVDWERESLVVLSAYYGTGMAKAHLDLTQPTPDVIQATIVWTLPPPPHTPDTAVFRGAFLVDKSRIREVRVTGHPDHSLLVSIGP